MAWLSKSTNLVTESQVLGTYHRETSVCEVLNQSGPLFSIIMYDTLIYFLEYVEYYNI